MSNKYPVLTVAEILGFDKVTIYRWINSKKLKAEKDFRGITVVDISEVEKLKAIFKHEKSNQGIIREFISMAKANGKTASETLEYVDILTQVL